MQREARDDQRQHRHGADQQTGVRDCAPLLQRQHFAQIDVVTSQVGTEKRTGEGDEQREDHGNRGRHVDEEVVECQPRPAADDDVRRIPDQCCGAADVGRQHLGDQIRLSGDA